MAIIFLNLNFGNHSRKKLKVSSCSFLIKLSYPHVLKFLCFAIPKSFELQKVKS